MLEYNYTVSKVDAYSNAQGIPVGTSADSETIPAYIVIKSPSGQAWKLVVDDAGSVSATPISN